MKEQKTTTVELRLLLRLGDEIDHWHRKQPDLSVRAEASRGLIELGLKASEK